MLLLLKPLLSSFTFQLVIAFESCRCYCLLGADSKSEGPGKAADNIPKVYYN